MKSLKIRLAQVQNAAHNVGAKVAVGATAAFASAASFAQAVDPKVAILADVNESLSSGLEIAGAVVLGIFAIWGVKLLLKGK